MKYEKRKERRYRVNSYHALDTNDQLGEEMLQDTGTEPIEEIVIRKILIEQLKKSLELLSDEEMELIQGLFYMGISERELTALTGIPQKNN